MGFDERIGWLLVGMAVGFVAGYIVRALREIRDKLDETKEELDEVDEIVKRRLSDEGASRHDVMMVVALVLVLFSVFASVRAANKTTETQNKLVVVSTCSQEFLSRTVKALNERTTYSTAQATKNVELQKAQANFFSFLLDKPPHPENERVDSANNYVETLNEFVHAALTDRLSRLTASAERRRAAAAEWSD